MKKLLPPLCIALAIGGGAAIASTGPALIVAGPCVGPSGLHACVVTGDSPPVEPGKGPTVGDCIYLASDDCTPVYVTLPGIGDIPYVDVYCGDTPCFNPGRANT